MTIIGIKLSQFVKVWQLLRLIIEIIESLVIIEFVQIHEHDGLHGPDGPARLPRRRRVANY